MVHYLLLLMLTVATSPAPGAAAPRARLSPSEDAERLLATPERRVRATDSRIGGLIDQGVRRSYTFARIVQALHDTDIIVYVEPTKELPGSVDGHLFLVTCKDGMRYLRIQVRPDLHKDETISLIGHELRHALEVAAEANVRTAESFRALYKRIGVRDNTGRRFDTAAARDAGREIRRELGG